MARNPFKPSSGATPPLLVGREQVLEDFAESLDDGPGAPGRLTIFTGARGVGKTVMLTEIAETALPRGWLTLAETATPGLVDRLAVATTRLLHEHDVSSRPTRSITGFTAPVIGGGLNLSPPQPETVTQWRDDVGSLLDVLEPRGSGLLLTVDEIHHAAREDLRAIAATFQHLVREDRDIALGFAGLPSAVSDLLNDDVLTFLRRATRVQLEDVPLDDVRAALRATITDSGLRITDPALDTATRATGGYPFMIQLVGYHIWRKATDGVIDEDAVEAGVPAARKRLGSTVHATALADLSDVDRTYLLAMAQDDSPSRTAVIAERLEVSESYASVYRGRLIDGGVIERTSHGYVDFTIPYLREYLREHAARYEMAGRHQPRVQMARDVAGYREAKASDDGTRVTLDELRVDLESESKPPGASGSMSTG